MVETVREKTLTLCELKIGESLTVNSVGGEPAMKRRLEDLGVVSGTRMTFVMPAPLGDPRAYRIRGAVIALRNADAKQIVGNRWLSDTDSNGGADGMDQTFNGT